MGGDGAVAAGGEHARHSSTGAAEKVWSAVRPDYDGSCTEWGLFHRIDSAVDHTLKSQSSLVELIDLSREMGQLFATGDGRALYRGVQAQMGGTRKVVPDQGGTRSAVAIAKSIEYVTENLEALHVAMHARQGGASGRGQKSG